MDKKILTYTIIPIVSTGILVSSISGIITNKKKEEEPHLIHNPYELIIDRGGMFISGSQSSPVATNTFEDFLRSI
jgi:hypothetical protein